MEKLKNIEKIIRSIIKEQDEMVIKPKVKANDWENVEVYKNPIGMGFLLPKNMLYDRPQLYNKKEWIEWYANFGNTRKQFDIVLKNGDTTYKKMCMDAQYPELIKKFIEVRDKWIPDDIAKNTLAIDQDYVDEAIAVMDYYNLNSTKPTLKNLNHELADEISGYTPSKKQFLDGTDYFFSVMQLWIDSNKNINLKFQKGNFSNHEEILRPKPKQLQLKDRTISFWKWGIERFEFCDAQGQFISYFTAKSRFVSDLVENSVASFKLVKSKYVEWVKNFKYVDENEIKKLDLLPDPINFHACYKVEKGAQIFRAYYTDYNKVNDANLQKGKVWNCFGHKFPENGEILGLSKISSVLSEPGLFSKGKFETSGILDIPLTYIEANNQGQFYKQFVETQGITAIEEGATGTLQTLFQVINNAPAGTLSALKAIKNIVDVDNYYNKAEVTIATPLDRIAPGSFKEQDFIAHTKITEETEIYTIPQGGLSQYIPTAKKAKNGKWFIKFIAGGNKMHLFLPSSEWWEEFGTSIYKIKNKVKTMGLNDEYPEFGLVLSVASETNLATIIDTKGEEGWTFKLSQTGAMFFGVRSGEKNYNEEGYFQLQNQITPYNFQNTDQFDSRSEFGRFIESWWGILAQVVIGIYIAISIGPFLAGAFITRILASPFVINSPRLLQFFTFLNSPGIFQSTIITVWFSIFAEIGLLGVPLATYYSSRGDEMGVILSLALCFIPLALETRAWGNFTKSLWQKTLPIKSLQQAILKQPSGFFNPNMTAEQLLDFMGTLSRREAMLFGELINNLDEMRKIGGLAKILEYSEPAILRLMEENSEKLIKAMPKFRKLIELGGVNILATGGAVFTTVTGVQVLITVLQNQKRELTDEEMKTLELGVKKMMSYFEGRIGKLIEDVQKANKKANKEAFKEIMAPEEWAIDFLKSNNDLLNKFLEKGGWEKVVPVISSGYDSELNGLLSKNPKDILTMWGQSMQKIVQLIKGGEGGVKRDEIKDDTIPDIEVSATTGTYKYSKGIIYKKDIGKENFVEVTDEQEKSKLYLQYFEKQVTTYNDSKKFETDIKKVRDYFPCLTEDKFRFVGGSSDPDFYLTFEIISGDYTSKFIDVIYDWYSENANDYLLLGTDNQGYVTLLSDEIINHYGCKVQ